tara:strand:+ start:2504 stop:2686 length:183 start_codon:yes stop_codon:yes gene_type:complete
MTILKTLSDEYYQRQFEETTELLWQWQLENIAKTLNGKIIHKTHTDHTGKNWKSIEIIYD